MEFTVWTESGASDKKPGSEGLTAYDLDNVAGMADSKKLGLQMDFSGDFKPKMPADDTNFDYNNTSREQDSGASWNFMSPDLSSAFSQDQQLLWEDDFGPLGQSAGAAGDTSANAEDTSLTKDSGEKDDEFDTADTLGDLGDKLKYRHKRELSDTFTMRVPLVSRSHNEGSAETVAGSAGTGEVLPGLGFSPEMRLMQTPIRGGSNGSIQSNMSDGAVVNDSPNYLVNGLESPMESPALQSPYMQYMPFPMVQTVPSSATTIGGTPSATSSARKLSGAGSPKSRRKSSSASQSSIASPLMFEAGDMKATDYTPQTPRPRSTGSAVAAAGVSKPKHKRTMSSASVSLTPKASGVSTAASAAAAAESASAAKPTTPLRGSNLSQASSSTATPSAGPNANANATNTNTNTNATNANTNSNTTPRSASVSNTPTQTPTPAKEGKRDGRKRIAKDQIDILEAFFHKNPRPEREDRLRLAAETNLEQRTVQIWFQNRRAKSRSMKMPPSKADTSMPAMQFRAAAAAASNALAGPAAGNYGQKHPGLSSPAGFEYDYWNNNGMSPVSSSQLRRNASTGGFPRMPPAHMGPLTGGVDGMAMSQQYPPHHQRWNSMSSSSSHPMAAGYHQQLTKHNAQQSQAMAAQMQRMQQLQHMQQFQQPQMQQQQQHRMQQQQQQQFQQFRSSQFNSQGMVPQMPPMNRSHSLSMFEPYMTYRNHADADFDGGMYGNDMMMGAGPGRSDSMISLASMGSEVPPSPLTADNMTSFSPDLRSLQNSPDLVSPVAWPGALGRTQSSATLHSMDSTGPGEIKRRRSLFGNTAPNWNSQYDATDSMVSSRTSPTQMHDTSNTNSVAAAAAAAALRTRNRSYTQPVPRSRQPSIRLHLDESNNAAQLVVLPDDRELMASMGSSENPGLYREMSPGRAERAAEKLLAERVAAASMNRRAQVPKNE